MSTHDRHDTPNETRLHSAALLLTVVLVVVPLVGAGALLGTDVADMQTRSTEPPLTSRWLAPRASDPTPRRLERNDQEGRYAWIALGSAVGEAEAVARALTTGRDAIAPTALRCHADSPSVCELTAAAVELCVQSGPPLADLPTCEPVPEGGKTLLGLFQETAAVEAPRLAEDCQAQLCREFAWELGEQP